MKSLFIITLFCTLFCFQIKAETKLPDSYSFNRGVEAYQAGNNQDALDWFNKELQEHPDNGYAYIYIASMRYGNNEMGKAMSAINQAIKNCQRRISNIPL